MQSINLGIATAKIELRLTKENEHILLPEPKFYRELSLHGMSHHVQVYVFSPKELSVKEGQLYGYCYEHGEWIRKPVPFPDVIYDRCFFQSSKERQHMDTVYSFLRKQHAYQLLNNSLPSKLVVYEQLSNVTLLSHYLPHTESIQSVSQLLHWLSQHPAGVIVKPASGMHGKGVLHISYNEQEASFHVNGRGLKNEGVQASFVREVALLKWFYKFKKDLPYIIQPYFHLRTRENLPFDIRVLLQKDHNGRWSQTGVIARIGEQHGLTSNLHGGGEAVLPLPLLTENLGSSNAERLMSEIHMISGQTAVALEENFGRFGELAFDFGIDHQGHIWILECNSKPGRQAFSSQLTAEQASLAIERPLQYSHYLVNHYNFRRQAVM